MLDNYNHVSQFAGGTPIHAILGLRITANTVPLIAGSLKSYSFPGTSFTPNPVPDQSLGTPHLCSEVVNHQSCTVCIVSYNPLPCLLNDYACVSDWIPPLYTSCNDLNNDYSRTSHLNKQIKIDSAVSNSSWLLQEKPDDMSRCWTARDIREIINLIRKFWKSKECRCCVVRPIA
ncbi:hypothetical protein BDR07DRAFT_892795 [Suillus spraguei]|nr:hypothetical protein BDR07DRAFT_892795 [Suillus spraguei]